ncbi:type III PLP-dependent enzyme domain-containing protein [Roseivivax sediminis]|uniref:ornithine decarboxylase n=1 Tax=Roseivivax sediminis TaxID=936889 RepID=A0A1I2BNJ2_9RHOB|nr:type III PLP-dependent enzyme [Roseivivax sediminis]SFE57701.1 ornithine decarboxylase [Roseivivax sediminis]
MTTLAPEATDASEYLIRHRPDAPVMFFRPDLLAATAAAFRAGFPGRVTYAVKANPAVEVLGTLAAAGIDAFDVASPEEMTRVREAAPGAALHYNNPVRSADEIAAGKRMGVDSWSVDRMSEFDKLGALPEGSEVSVRLALPVPGAAYDFGSKFGAGPDLAVEILAAVAARGFVPALTFHPGTQCPDGAAWARYIHACADIARRADVQLARLNVGGGFPAHRGGAAPDLAAIFAAIRTATAEAFEAPPALICEPGRAMVAEAVTLALRVKAVESGALTLNDGVYGALGEWRDLPAPSRIDVISPDGHLRRAAGVPRIVFGPTCDSLDRLPRPLDLPGDIAEGDYLLIPGMGAYGAALVTAFNGYGARDVVTMRAG